MNDEKISVIITTHNRAQKVSRAIQSALAQTRQPDEIIIVDDGSTDATPKVLDTFRDRTTVIVQQNMGFAEARNTGFSKSSGDYIAFLDDDDEWYPWKLEIQLQLMKALPEVQMICTEVEAVGEEGRFPQFLSNEYFHRYREQFEIKKSDIFQHSRTLQDIGITQSHLRPDATIHYGYLFEYLWLKLFVLNSTVLWRRQGFVPFPLEVTTGNTDTPFYIERSKTCMFGYLDLAAVDYSIFASDGHISQKLTKFHLGVVQAHRKFYGQGDGLKPEHQSYYQRQLAYYLHRIGRGKLLSNESTDARKHALDSLKIKWNQIAAYGILILSITPRMVIEMVMKYWK